MTGSGGLLFARIRMFFRSYDGQTQVDGDGCNCVAGVTRSG